MGLSFSLCFPFRAIILLDFIVLGYKESKYLFCRSPIRYRWRGTTYNRISLNLFPLFQNLFFPAGKDKTEFIKLG